ncbi:hypothetical protein [Bacillus sp. CGMCC 1.16541]|uniref:hypothetical protein n=1 Tax=Bacillus sp. CGMCC 1.16541 TaxID=2185143 RepID=UPI0013A54D84|nr:hypothetical protein [Bacillus sp. CGMCC 1.16541]
MAVTNVSVYSLFSAKQQTSATVSVGSSPYFSYILGSTNVKQPNDSSKNISTGIDETLRLDKGNLSSLLDSYRPVDEAFTITNKTNSARTLQLSVENVTRPMLALVGTNYMVSVPSSITIPAQTTRPVTVTTSFLPLLRIGGTYTGNIVIRDIEQGITFRVPIRVFIILL